MEETTSTPLVVLGRRSAMFIYYGKILPLRGAVEPLRKGMGKGERHSITSARHAFLLAFRGTGDVEL